MPLSKDEMAEWAFTAALVYRDWVVRRLSDLLFDIARLILPVGFCLKTRQTFSGGFSLRSFV